MNYLLIKIAKIINLFLEKIGIKIVKSNINLESTMSGGLKRLSKRMSINSVIDVGASNGCWSEKARKYFPESKFLLIEAQKEHEKELIKFIKKKKGFDYIISAAGDTNGQIYFDSSSLFGGSASKEKINSDNCLKLSSITIDNAVKQKRLKGPFLIKLDTHGFELPIFKGASQTLKKTNALIIESYNFKISKISLRFQEMINFLEKRGFRCIDIVDLMRRPTDDAFWQMDLIFIRSNRKEFRINKYE